MRFGKGYSQKYGLFSQACTSLEVNRIVFTDFCTVQLFPYFSWYLCQISSLQHTDFPENIYCVLIIQTCQNIDDVSRSRIHDCTISLRFMGITFIILRVIRLEVSVYNVYITNQFQTTFISTFLGPNGTRFARCHFRVQKSLDFQGPSLPMPLASKPLRTAQYKQQVH